MYIVNLYNGDVVTEIHGEKEKLKSGSVVKGINSIDSFSFTLLPSNAGFDKIHDFQTLVSVYNTNQNRYEFYGRVLYPRTEMDESGKITKEVTCESYLAFLCDSQQKYVEEKNWTVRELLTHIVNQHNSQVEEYKQFTIGEVTVTDPNDNLYLGIQRENTWKTIEEKLIGKLGGEIQFRVVDGVLYIDYLELFGTTRETKISLSRNMQAISRENDPSAYVTRLIPLGCKLKDDEGSEVEERLDITSVNGGRDYIDDVAAVEAYGIHVGCVEFDDITLASNLLNAGRKWLVENNKVQVKYSVTALDLSLLGLDIDDFCVHDSYPIVNPLLGINDTARIIKKTIDVCEEIRSTIEIGDNFKTQSDIQLEQAGKVDSLVNTVGKIETNYVTNQQLANESASLNSSIQQTVQNITLSIEDAYTKTSTYEEFKQLVESQFELMSRELTVKFTETNEHINNVGGDLQSKYNTITQYFTFDINGMTIGRVDSPYKVVIANDRYSMHVNGVEVLWFDAEGKGHIPELTVTRFFDMFGYHISEDDFGNVNCVYIEE